MIPADTCAPNDRFCPDLECAWVTVDLDYIGWLKKLNYSLDELNPRDGKLNSCFVENINANEITVSLTSLAYF